MLVRYTWIWGHIPIIQVCYTFVCYRGSPGASDGKESAFTDLRCRRPGFDPWVGKIRWRREWLPTPAFLPGESHGYTVTFLEEWTPKRTFFWRERGCVCLVAQSCPPPCNLMDCSQPGSSVHGILQAGTLVWVALPSSRGSSPLRDWMWVSCIAGEFFTIWATREAQAKCDGYGVAEILCIYSVLHNFVV